MIKLIVLTSIFVLIVSTSLIKNSTKDLDDQIYSIKENILFLENRFQDSKLEFDYLSSSEKLLEYQKLYFENSLIKKTLKELNTLEIIDNELIVNELKISEKIYEQKR
ncbi:cell division protein FtsL [Candidatus Pelagibacter sp.]|nr:cell division protein FtsL [Candidatus Pelagibacter sp.]